MKFCIYGAGAVGGFLAFRLAQAGHRVAVVARGAHLAAIIEQGLGLQTRDGRLARLPIEASDDPARFGPQDCVILAVKQPALPAIAGRLASLLDEETMVVPAINGVPWWFFDGFGGPLAGSSLRAVDPDGETARNIEGRRIVGCVVHIAASMQAPGVIRHGFGERFILGEPSGRMTERLARLAAAMAEAGLRAEQTAEIQRAVWAKLWGNITYNPISALTRASSVQMQDDPLIMELFRGMMVEVAEIGRRIGIEVGMTPDERIAIARQLGDFKTSMLQDLEAGRALELDGLVGAVIEIAEKLGQAAPLTRAVLGLTRLMAANLGLGQPGAEGGR
ncbi:MAG: 2-dehydropantoate 2-reductase [Alphaproteobacteria bacterium]|nr:2-dehydropantoate 2-reductase [Alphaproteobacteria bacterium]